MTVVCALTYIQLEKSISALLPDAHVWIEGSTKMCSVQLQRDHVARVGERGVGVALDQPAHQPVGEVGRAEQSDLAQHVQPSFGQEARLQDTSAGEHLL